MDQQPPPIDESATVLYAASEPAESEDRPISGIWKFVSFGIVKEDGIYIKRKADSELLAMLQGGRSAYILGPRRIGKTSLAVRTMDQMKRQSYNWRCVVFDLEIINKESTLDQIFYSILTDIAKATGTEQELNSFWVRYSALLPGDRWLRFIEDIIITTGLSVLLFLDEVDSILKLNESDCATFFGAIRRSIQDLQIKGFDKKFLFCLGGVTAPIDLIPDPEKTPFNIIAPVYLEDFSREEMKKFNRGFSLSREVSKYILDRIYYWTSGQPALTQYLCNLVNERFASKISKHDAQTNIDKLVQDEFLTKKEIHDPTLGDTARRFGHHDREPHIRLMLELYKRILDGEEVESRRDDRIQLKLQLTGLAAERQNPESSKVLLKPRNRLFEELFGQTWLKKTREHHSIDDAFRPWLQNNRSPAFLVKGVMLEELVRWSQEHKDLTPEESAFLLASLQAAKVEEVQKRRSLIFWVLSAIGVLALVATSYFWSQAERKQRALAVAERRQMAEALRVAEQTEARERELNEILRRQLRENAEAHADAVTPSPEEQLNIDDVLSTVKNSTLPNKPTGPLPINKLSGLSGKPISTQLYLLNKQAAESKNPRLATAWKTLFNHQTSIQCSAVIPQLIVGKASGLALLEKQVKTLIDDHQDEAALPLARCLHAGRTVLFGAVSASVLQSLLQLAHLSYKNKDYVEEKQLTIEALNLAGELYGWSSMDVARLRDSLALLYLRKEDNGLVKYAISEYELSIAVKEKLLASINQSHKRSRPLEEELERTKAALASARKLDGALRQTRPTALSSPSPAPSP